MVTYTHADLLNSPLPANWLASACIMFSTLCSILLLLAGISLRLYIYHIFYIYYICICYLAFFIFSLLCGIFLFKRINFFFLFFGVKIV